MNQKKDRVLELFYRLMIGREISVAEMADEYRVSTKSITRDMNEIKDFVAEHGDMFTNAEIKYSASTKKYYMKLDHFLNADELLAMVKMLIGCRGFSKNDTLEIISKLKMFTGKPEQELINDLISNEL